MRKKMLFLISFIISSFLMFGEGKTVILCYHTFSGTLNSSLDFSIEELKEHLAAYRAKGYSFLNLDDFINGKNISEKNIVITIDDGHHTVKAAWENVFKPQGIKPALFIYPNVIGRTEYSLSRENLKALYDSGLFIGAHGYYHEFLTQKAFEADYSKAASEIIRTGPAIEKITGLKPETLAYPFGAGSPEAEKLLVKYGYKFAFTAVSGIEMLEHPVIKEKPYSIPRTIVYKWNYKTILKSLE
jgi:peptidoglycan/xylan/chitin deacetylase (PgdA/CDA1 family)